MGFFKASKMVNGYRQLRIGMQMSEVLKLLGNPTGRRVRDGVTTLTWQNSEFKGMLRGGTIVRKVIVDFENDAVTGFDSENMDRSAW